MIYEAANKTNAFENIDDNLKQYWRKTTLSMTINQVIRSDKFLKIYKEFSEADIDVLVFKGIICRQLYPNPDQRISSDEDILVMILCLLIYFKLVWSIWDLMRV